MISRRAPLFRVPLLSLLAVLSLGACSADKLYTVPTPPAQAAVGRIAIAYASVEVQDVSLPEYASGDAIPMRDDDGSVTASKNLLWADLPTRAVTLELSRYLRQITGAEVAPSPWPFLDRAQVRVDVRVEQMLAEANGSFRLSGQYFVAPETGARGRSALFDLTVPIGGDGGAVAIAAARGQAVLQLAQLMAQSALR
ncbi:membrane integrity-associated transporter subunit PqiC [Pseudooceanicola sediminis]|uniref:Membrane integrity-associated transporter subunit PqiC n=1 Tax=Pseudooceanicola sediminis TaxID=2211117 RepID=A0A399IZ23_9RHOB|nr:PqiC family protein [Pseudooceanicola sediminis]KAA2313453.1 membrane integrity-associated transporter subunit PqiC [Puniceibacterium sp. HSS470]RII38271.1 membrane integrity-associated transporter subunit PqiC [Pseudooceanicola sediminis]|tara:strand:+ start:44808 stop:45398 length:591 start_codon:yes stop_codon:yes gene_type:complete